MMRFPLDPVYGLNQVADRTSQCRIQCSEGALSATGRCGVDNRQRLPILKNFDGLACLAHLLEKPETGRIEFGNVDLFHA